MKIKSQSILLLGILSISWDFSMSQSLGLPSVTSLEKIAKDSGVSTNSRDENTIAYEDADFNPPDKGRLRKADLKIIERMYAVSSADFEAAPNDQTGKQSSYYPILGSWIQGLQKVIHSNLESDLFCLIPQVIFFVERVSRDEKLAVELKRIETYMVHSGDYLIRALSYHIVHEQGAVSVDLLRQAVRLFGNGRLVDETAWDVDDPMPVDSAGIFILNPELAVEELKKRPVERVRFFLTNVTDSGEFFERYGGEGDGLEVLKARYAANRAAIEAKHREMVAWLGAQSGQ